jgi:hypothetical protein
MTRTSHQPPDGAPARRPRPSTSAEAAFLALGQAGLAGRFAEGDLAAILAHQAPQDRTATGFDTYRTDQGWRQRCASAHHVSPPSSLDLITD